MKKRRADRRRFRISEVSQVAKLASDGVAITVRIANTEMVSWGHQFNDVVCMCTAFLFGEPLLQIDQIDLPPLG